MEMEESQVPEDLKDRTRNFSLRVISMYGKLPKSTVAQVLGKQVIRSATSVGAHYREGLRARSTAEYISKLEGGMQELEETAYWFELIVGAKLFTEQQMSSWPFLQLSSKRRRANDDGA